MIDQALWAQAKQLTNSDDNRVIRAAYEQLLSESDVVRAGEEDVDVIRCRAQLSASNVTATDKPWKQGEPVTFTYLPAGLHTITAGFRKGSVNLTVLVDQDAAKAAQRSYDSWRERMPKQKLYGCVEHREQEASVIARGFSWQDGEGVVISAEPTALGEQNVNGKIHWGWSPSFMTDADYTKAVEFPKDSGQLRFPDGVRGSASNPARITGISRCVGTLTNNPAFHEMPPVKASEPVMASGTSEGVKKAWLSRKGEGGARIERDDSFMMNHHREEERDMIKALRAENNPEKKSGFLQSKLAHTASADAYATGSSRDHEMAAEDHEHAARLMKKHGEEALARAHFAHAETHKILSRFENTHTWTTASDRSSDDAVQVCEPAKRTASDILRAAKAPASRVSAILSAKCMEMLLGEPVKAAGTSEGVRKSWEHRKHALSVWQTSGHAFTPEHAKHVSEAIEEEGEETTFPLYRNKKAGGRHGIKGATASESVARMFAAGHEDIEKIPAGVKALSVSKHTGQMASEKEYVLHQTVWDRMTLTQRLQAQHKDNMDAAARAKKNLAR